MALTITVVNDERKAASAPLGFLELSFAGETTYPAGGTPDFEDAVAAVVGRNVDVLAVVKSGACGVYTPIYDKANDKLYVEDAAGAQATGDISTTTFYVTVIYQ